MRQVAIHLSEPFEQILTSLRTLPSTAAETGDARFAGGGGGGAVVRDRSRCDAEVKEALRSLYEAANGRQVETQIGLIAIAPPIAGFLKEEPYYAGTQYEFFLEAFTRILARDSARKQHTDSSCTPGGKRVSNLRGIGALRGHARGANGNVLLCPTSPRLTRSRRIHAHD
jgi:hypothetical protein